MPAYYVHPDGKTVSTFRLLVCHPGMTDPIHVDGLGAVDAWGQSHRLFAVHPDDNQFVRTEADGTYTYCPPGIPPVNLKES